MKVRFITADGLECIESRDFKAHRFPDAIERPIESNIDWNEVARTKIAPTYVAVKTRTYRKHNVRFVGTWPVEVTYKEIAE